MNIQKLFKKIQKEYNKFIVKTFARSSDIQKVADELYGDVGWVPMHVNCNCIYEPIGDDNLSVNTTHQLLKKYNRAYVPGEKRTKNTETEHKQKQTLKEKHRIADELIREADKLHLTGDDVEHVYYLIDKFTDFNKLYRNTSKECIILAFIWYTFKLKNPKRRINEYSINKKYGLTEPVFELISVRMLKQLLADTPIIPKGTSKYDNNILYKTGVRR
jgi:hypothetical protein